MANDKMTAQISGKDGFIAALDQSGGSTLCASTGCQIRLDSDWKAPTGGYFLRACMATGHAAGHGVLDWLRSG
jgi:hypothetical protein